MSVPQQVDLNCPSCSRSQNVTVWSTVNATLEPQLKNAVVEGDINFFQCTSCQEVGRIPWDMLYHDMERKVMIWLIHGDGTGNVQYPDNFEKMFDHMARNYQLRIVTSFPQMVEKIFLFDDGLDDRVVEFLKYAIWKNHGPEQYPPDTCLVCEGLTTQSSKERELVFILLDESGKRAGYTYPWNAYLETVTFVRDRLGDLSECEGSWLTVNRDFVSRMLVENGGQG